MGYFGQQQHNKGDKHMITRENLNEKQKATAAQIEQAYNRIRELDQERGQLAVAIERLSERMEVYREISAQIPTETQPAPQAPPQTAEVYPNGL